ncbi:T9SS type A sorting domain-containing protein [Botryobacter ruber]|uniref:T9SS type A sorting domain-containing protein n=1 Tax=Botryobacter ruber TaxID=2171629 RepID=UPI000E0A5AC5|nr:T9SS type A sorting domain-containing protein [Botryobacter ruber]
MNRIQLSHYFVVIFAVILLACQPGSVRAQTPGLIYKPASSGGNLVLDPNGDGYVSAARVPSGFADTKDERAGYSEITYRPFPALSNEPLGDIVTGSGGGHTDLAPPQYTGATGSPIAAYFDGKNVMFRIRLGGASTASKGYSVVIDTNQQFGDLVEGGNPATTPNPGFEFEVVFASNFDVSIYDHRGKASGGSKIWTGSVEQFSQKAVAASTASGNTDYFYDFYVPLAAFPTTGSDLLTASTPLRLSGITVTSAQSGVSGTVSDVGGVNFAAYGHSKQSAWADVVSSFPPTSLNQLQSGDFGKIQATAPVVNSPVIAGATTVKGISVEAAGSAILVYRTAGGVTTQIGTATVGADGSWSATVTAGVVLAVNDAITATVTPASKATSALSVPVTVTAGACTATPAPVISGLISSGNTRGFTGTTSYAGNQRITIYSVGSGFITSVNWNTTTQGTTWSTGYLALADNSYYATVTPLDGTGNISGCESLRSNQLCYQNGQPKVNTQILQITSVTYDGSTQSNSTSSTWHEVPANIASISGSLSLSGTSIEGNIVVFRNGVASALSVPFTTATTTWTIPLTDAFRASLQAGDVLSVRTDITLSGGGQITCTNSYSSASNLLTVQATTATPTINAPGCGLVTTLSGTSTEAAGTVLQFYTNGTAGLRDGALVVLSGTTTAVTATVTTQGNWTASFTGVAGGGIAAATPITARAKAANKVRSVNSAAVSAIAAAPVPGGATFTIDPVTEPAAGVQYVTIRGTGPASAGGTTYYVTVSIAGTLFAPVATTATGTWELNGISPLEVYTGAVIAATFSSSASSCPSAPVTTTVLCTPPSSAFTTSFAGSNSICYNGTVSVTLSGSEVGVAYRLTNNGTPTGASVIGTGGAITLTSDLLTASTTTLSVRATDVGSDCVTTGIGGNKTITVAAAPAQPTSLVASFTSGCSSVTTTITLNGPAANTTYQLINYSTRATIGSPQVIGASAPASVTMATNLTRYTSTTFGVLITPTSGCTSVSDRTATVTVTEGPSLTQAVTIDKPAPCAGEQVTISVATQYNSGYTYVIKDDLNNIIGASFTGTGAVVSRTTAYAGGVTAMRTFRVEVTGGCATNAVLATTVTATPGTAAPAANAGTAQEVCCTVTLNANYASPGVGTWSMTGGIPMGVTFSNINDPKATVSGLGSGTYTLTWTINNTCGGSNTTSFSSVQITINCPAAYVVTAPKYASQYKSGDVLASASDADGGVTGAVLLSGSLPAWAELLSNGNVVVKSGATVVAGTYSFTVRTTDAYSKTTDSPVTLTIYGDMPLLAPLPVELAYFTAVVADGAVALQWLTATEKDNDKFIIERSSNGRDFKAIGEVKGQGNSSTAIRYSFTDKMPLAGSAYYRLKQLDYDGKHSYSNVIAVEAKGVAANLQLQAYPNPFSDKVTIAVTSPVAEKAQLHLLDVQGRVLLTKTVELRSGLTEVELGMQAVAGGVYILKLTGNGIDAKTRIMKSN